jgi:hypothetical protein
MHDVVKMHKTKRTNKSNRGFSGAVTIDTTNKETRPEIPRHDTWERGEISDLQATRRSPRHH